MAGFRVRALYEFWAQNPAELSFQPGQIINVISQEDEGWWEGELSGHRGLFPSNYVEIIIGGVINGNSQDFSYQGSNIGAQVPTAAVEFMANPAAYMYQAHQNSNLPRDNSGYEDNLNNPNNLSSSELQQLQIMQAALISQLQEQGMDTNPIFGSLLAQNTTFSKLPSNDGQNHLGKFVNPEFLANNGIEMSDLAPENEQKQGHTGENPNIKRYQQDQFQGNNSQHSGQAFYMKTNNLGPGFRWINVLGLIGALLCLASGPAAIILCAQQRPPPASPPYPHLVDYNFTQYVGLYSIFAGLFTLILEYFHIRVGENSFCPMNSRAVVYLFLSVYMFLSFPTLGVALFYCVLLAPLQVFYERNTAPSGWGQVSGLHKYN